MAQNPVTLLEWDLESIYPSIADTRFETDVARVYDLLSQIEATISACQPASAELPIVAAIVEHLNEALKLERKLEHYLDMILFDQPASASAHQVQEQLRLLRTRRSVVETKWSAFLAAVDPASLGDSRSDIVSVHNLAKLQQSHQLDADTERILATLSMTGSQAWQALYRQQLATLSVSLPTPDGTSRSVPFHVTVGLALSPDRAQRQMATHAGATALAAHADVLGAALNNIKGEALALAQLRRFETPLNEALFRYRLNAATFRALRRSIEEYLPKLQQFLAVKAKVLGLPRLAFYDLFAPVSPAISQWSVEAALAFVREQFDTFSPNLAAIVDRAVAERWIKVRSGGLSAAAYSVEDDIARIRTDFSGLVLNVRLLGHEFGHMYHYARLATRPMILRQYPRSLAETASIFCEHLVDSALLTTVAPQERLGMLDAALSEAVGMFLLQWAQILFEDDVFERRSHQSLSVNELNSLMSAHLNAAFGPDFEPTPQNEVLWLMQGQLFETSYWTIPYIFGRLFSTGLLEFYGRDPETFRERYDAFLAASGEHDVALLANTLGIDVEDSAFWAIGLSKAVERIQLYDHLVAQQSQGNGATPSSTSEGQVDR